MKLSKEFIAQWSEAIMSAVAAFETGSVVCVTGEFTVYKAISTAYTGVNVFYAGKQLCTLDENSIPTAAGALNYGYTLEDILLARLNREISKQAVGIVGDIFNGNVFNNSRREIQLFGLTLFRGFSDVLNQSGVTLITVKKDDEIVGLYQCLTDADIKFAMDDISELAIRGVADRIRAGELDFEI